MNYLPIFNRISRVNTTKKRTAMSYYFFLKWQNRPSFYGKAQESEFWRDCYFSPASRPMAGPRRCELTSTDRYRCWDSVSSHRILNDDILGEAMRLAGIGADEDKAEEEDLADLRLSGLSDMSLPGEMEGWDLQDVLRTPPPPFRPPPPPDQSEDETDDNSQDQQDDDDQQSQDDHRDSQRDSENDTSQSAEGSTKSKRHDTSLDSELGDESTDRDSDVDKTSDQGDCQADNHSQHDDEEHQDPGSGPQIVSDNHSFDPAFRPQYVRNKMNNQEFCRLCRVPDRFQTWITRGMPVFIDRTFSRKRLVRMCAEEELQAQAHIHALAEAGLIERCSRANFVSLPKIVPKGTSSSRLVIDYSHLTDYMVKTPFYLPSVYSVVFDKLPAVTSEHYMIKIDLTAAFYHINLTPEARHFTTFRWKDSYFRFKVLPMGLRISPYYMQMWLNQIVDFLRATGAFVWGHMDDIIVIGTKRQLSDVTEKWLPQLMATGVQLNNKKSNLEPVRELVFCGALWDLNKRIITITNAKKRKLKQAVHAWPSADTKTRERIMGFLSLAFD